MLLSEQWNRDAALAEQAAALEQRLAVLEGRTVDGAAAAASLAAQLRRIRDDRAGHLTGHLWAALTDASRRAEALEQRLALAERRLAALNRHADGIHDSAACFERPTDYWCYSCAETMVGGRKPAEQLADAWEIADRVRAEGGGDAEVEAALDADRDEVLAAVVAAQMQEGGAQSD